ncbi:MAG: hypothetical protein J6S04_07195 [Clostridia bacterium]|nr:hypothetical protein [Clostridia bacterium]
MIKLKSSIAAGLVALLLSCAGGVKGELKDIAKPHLGMYECTEARMGDREYLDRFSYIHLELKADETFVLYYCEKDGKKRTQEGRYRYDKEKEVVTLLGGGVEREFPLSEGVLTITFSLGGHTVQLKFEQK